MKTPVAGFDFHFHADLFPDPAAVAACERTRIVTLAVTTTPQAWTQNRLWTEASHYVHAAVGLHPELVAERHAEIGLLEVLMKETPFVGEIGLDGSPQHRKSYANQKDVFVRALTAAQSLGGKVLSIHSPRAARDVLTCIRETTTVDRVLPILHWFSDSFATARQAAALGCFFSVNDRMLDHSAGEMLVRGLPADRLLTESDAPFTSADPRRNHPEDPVALSERLAAARSISVEELRSVVAANATRVFAFAGIQATFEPITPTRGESSV
jgi:TatD DNase family protein